MEVQSTQTVKAISKNKAVDKIFALVKDGRLPEGKYVSGSLSVRNEDIIVKK